VEQRRGELKNFSWQLSSGLIKQPNQFGLFLQPITAHMSASMTGRVARVGIAYFEGYFQIQERPTFSYATSPLGVVTSRTTIPEAFSPLLISFGSISPS
jgi:hypothetical protein